MKNKNGIPCGNMKEFDAVMFGPEPKTAHTPGAFIWLQETEDFGAAECGCILERRDNSSSAFLMCKTHAAAPELLEALKEAEKIIRMARQYFPNSIRNSDKFSLENVCASINSAIAKAEGRS